MIEQSIGVKMCDEPRTEITAITVYKQGLYKYENPITVKECHRKDSQIYLL